MPATSRRENLSNRQFGDWLVLRLHPVKTARTRWVCRCQCGTERPVVAQTLKNGASTNCGCRTGKPVERHGHASGKAGSSSEYRVWIGMIQRCTNPNASHFDRYGGRGILVCDRWRTSFADFLADVGRRPSLSHTLDRHPNPDGNYEPGNVRWATKKEQGNNRVNNRLLTHDGVALTVSQWADRLGWAVDLIRGRLKLGWPTADILTLPPEASRERATDPATGRFVSSRG